MFPLFMTKHTEDITQQTFDLDTCLSFVPFPLILMAGLLYFIRIIKLTNVHEIDPLPVNATDK